MNNKLSLSIVVLTIVLLIGNFSQAFSQGTLSPTKKELIKELATIMNIRVTASKDLEQRLTQLVAAVQNQVLHDSKSTQKEKEMSKEHIDELAHVMKVLPEKLNQRIDIGKFSEDLIIEVYDKYYTESEIKDFIAFYKSPTGQKSLHTMSVIRQEMVQITSGKIMPIISEIINEEMEKRKKSK